MSLTRGREQITLPAMIAADLRMQIETGVLQPGDQLAGHRDLAASYDVSLGSVREAISLLVGDGLVETRHGRGTFVAEQSRLIARSSSPVSRRDVEELTEARELIGLDIVAMAAERASADDVARLRDAVAQMQTVAADAEAYPDAEIAFHLVAADAAHNRFLRDAMERLSAMIRRDVALAASAGIQRFGSLQYAVDAHVELVDAIEDGEVEDACRVLREILHRTHEFVIALYAIGAAAPRGSGQ